MPTLECLIGELKGRLEESERAREERDAARDERDAARDARLARIEGKVDGVVADRLADRNQVSGAMWAFSKIGAGVVALLGILGWLAVNGVPAPVRRLFSP
jgi:hypothetical protein